MTAEELRLAVTVVPTSSVEIVFVLLREKVWAKEQASLTMVLAVLMEPGMELVLALLAAAALTSQESHKGKEALVVEVAS